MPLSLEDYYQAYRKGDTARAARIQESLRRARPVVPDLSKIPSKHVDKVTKSPPQPNLPKPARSRKPPQPSKAELPATARSARTVPAPVRSPVQIAPAEPPKPLRLGLNLPLSLPPAIPQAVKPAGIGAGVTAAIDFPVRVVSGQSTAQAAVGASGAAAGTFAGGVVGALAGPFGMYVGGAIGGQIGGAIADWIYSRAAPARERPEGIVDKKRTSPPFKGGQSSTDYLIDGVIYREGISPNIFEDINVPGPIRGADWTFERTSQGDSNSKTYILGAITTSRLRHEFAHP